MSGQTHFVRSALCLVCVCVYTPVERTPLASGMVCGQVCSWRSKSAQRLEPELAREVDIVPSCAAKQLEPLHLSPKTRLG